MISLTLFPVIVIVLLFNYPSYHTYYVEYKEGEKGNEGAQRRELFNGKELPVFIEVVDNSYGEDSLGKNGSCLCSVRGLKALHDLTRVISHACYKIIMITMINLIVNIRNRKKIKKNKDIQIHKMNKIGK